MSVKSFKFVSPGVFIHEIDNSFIPKSAEAIGPVVIGRSRRGLAMQPTKVHSYSEFVQLFGETVPGNGGGDIYRDGNYQSPMYGTYAAKAFLRANVAPLTYIRLLGEQDSNNTSAGVAGWKTTKNPAATLVENGGAYGLWCFHSSSTMNLGTGSLAAIFYVDNSGSVTLSGALAVGNATWDASSSSYGHGIGKVISTDSNNLFTIRITSSNTGLDVSRRLQNITFGFDETKETFIRKRFNTNPQLTSTPGTFYVDTSYQPYWLGESYEQEMRDGNDQLTGSGTSMVGAALQGVILPIALSGTVGRSPADMSDQGSVEGVAGWFIGQDLGAASSYVSFNAQKLFQLKGRGHGEWLQKNVKVSISNIKKSPSLVNPYGSFSVVLRALRDTDSNVQVLERYDNLNLDPTSPNYVARRIGDAFGRWDTTSRRLKTYGEYGNKSKFVYVVMNSAVENGATDPALLPFGYWGPPRFKSLMLLSGSGDSATDATGPRNGKFIYWPTSTELVGRDSTLSPILSASVTMTTAAQAAARPNDNTCLSTMTGSLTWPAVRLRHSASDGGLPNATDAYFGFQVTKTPSSTRPDASVADDQRQLYSGYGGGAATGVDQYGYVFSLDDIVYNSTDSGYYYQSGSRAAETSYTSGSYNDLLAKGYNRFTAPIWGAFDGFDIKVPDPMYNGAIGSSNTTSYSYYTIKRAIDTVADPESLDMNLLTMPGLTNDGLTTHMVNVCEERADAMALIDLANVYIPQAEAYYANKWSRVGTTPQSAADALTERQIDSSYGATFYPWVQTLDEGTGALLWVPPSAAMLGVLASSQARSHLWFAPAGFNRGGLSEGAAGIPVSNVTERLTSKQRDTLYEANINPIASFPSSGIVVFGQKTLQERQSALDRINVRRLVIYLKKQISILSTQVLFEQNVQATWNRFKSLVDPFLANVKTQFGITDYKLILDESTTTPDLIDQNIMYAKIMIKPARAIEYIAIDFVIASTGASFDD
jgi:hypothetical protein